MLLDTLTRWGNGHVKTPEAMAEVLRVADLLKGVDDRNAKTEKYGPKGGHY